MVRESMELPYSEDIAGRDSAELEREEKMEMDELKEELDLASDPLLGAAREREYQPITVPLRGSYNTSRMRTTVISALSIGLLLIIILHLPPSQLSKQLSDHFHYLNPGYFNPDLASSAPNPLPSSAFFSDIPFAKVDTGDLKEGEEVPAWATKEGSGGYSLEEELGRMKRGGRSWNGTHAWEKTVLIISLDGVRADYLQRHLTPHLLQISRKGLRAKFLRPVFPTLTFPNHYSLITGLYPASHGIVANDFIDVKLKDEFVYSSPGKSWDAKWWGGEPIWSTAVKSGLRTANLMWPSPPVMADGTKPTYWYPFQPNYPVARKVDKLASWFDMSFDKRPQLIMGYAPDVDVEGHRSGAHSDAVERTIAAMDVFALEVTTMLAKRNLTEIVDLVFVSDHGMTDTANERLVFLDEILGEEGFDSITSSEGWPSAGLRFTPSTSLPDMLSRLLTASTQPNSGFNVYTPSSMPSDFHFVNSDRIPPIYVVPDEGWAVTSRGQWGKMNGTFAPAGNHGYSNHYASMHAIFIAHGPFASRIKSNSRSSSSSSSSLSEEQEEEQEEDGVRGMKEENGITIIPGFDNLEVYNLVMTLLGVDEEKRARNNGTVGFWDRYLD